MNDSAFAALRDMPLDLQTVACPYCTKPAAFFADSKQFYRGTDNGPVWACIRCDARVGCHMGTARPLGRLANKDLRYWKVQAHGAFDPIWKAAIEQRMAAGKSAQQGKCRRKAYAKLAKALRIPEDECHIGMFDVTRCRKTVELCRSGALA